MIDSAALLADLKKQLKLLQADLRPQAEDRSTAWGARLREQHREATERERTSQAWVEWRDNQVDQAAVAWILACVFVRFCEDNRLLEGARDADGRAVPTLWLAGPDGRTARAVENQTEFVRGTAYNVRDWMLHAFGVLADQPAGAALLDRRHNLVWTAHISAEAAGGLAGFWRTTVDGKMVHDFTDVSLDTRFLGDLYQDLSDHAKKTYALLQTPVFVEEFILDQTLTPAIEEFGLDGLRLIDPTCGSGHFLLGAFARLNAAWAAERPGMPAGERLEKVLASVHGVDVNPFAVAIARFRLTVAAMVAGGWRGVVETPRLPSRVAVGDSLLGAMRGRQTEIDTLRGTLHTYDAEDLDQHGDVLALGTYHVVVGNPPYITVKDTSLSDQYREHYKATYRQYALSAPFTELFFRLARRSEPNAASGYVGQITSNSFAKREFGRVLVERFLSGQDGQTTIDLTLLIDTSGAYIPGHGTPTLIMVGRRRRPLGINVSTVLGVRGEPGQPANPARGHVWTEIVQASAGGDFRGRYVTAAETSRRNLSKHPWSLSGGLAAPLKRVIESAAGDKLRNRLSRDIGGAIRAGADEAYMRPRRMALRAPRDSMRPFVIGENLRDFRDRGNTFIVFPYDNRSLESSDKNDRALWRWRTLLRERGTFQGNMAAAAMRWTDYMQMTRWPFQDDLSITFAEVATHNHFVLDRGGKVFKQTAPLLRLSNGATEEDYLTFLGLLNSSAACFWMKQVSHDKGNGGYGGGIADQAWERFFQFGGTKLHHFPVPRELPRRQGRLLDELAMKIDEMQPARIIAGISNDALRMRVDAARVQWHESYKRAIFEQEELDWEVYRIYGLVDEDLTYGGSGHRSLALGERAFEVSLAREVEAGTEETAWFERHSSTPITELPAIWPDDYRALVQRRLDVIAEDPQIALLERPEHKRRWATPGWDRLLKDSLEEAVLDRLEEPSLWRDDSEVQLRTVAQVATSLRHDHELQELVTLYTGTSEHDLTAVLTALIADQAVPYLAAYRYKEAGVEKYRVWQEVWALQRREDAGKIVDVPVPPKYTQADFRSTAAWRNRGKLDVPKERFIAYPGVGRPGDRSPLLGWAGWSQEDQAIALAREVTDQEAEGAGAAVLEPMLAGLVELEPWLHQWHTDGERGNAAESITGFLDQQLEELGKTRADVDRWRPEPARRGRRPRS